MLSNNQIVKLSPPRFKSVIKMYQAAMDEEKYRNDLSLLQEEVSDTIASMIESVDGITDDDNIREWVGGISAGWVKEITSAVESVSDWGPNFDTEIKCKDCGEIITISTPVKDPLVWYKQFNLFLVNSSGL